MYNEAASISRFILEIEAAVKNLGYDFSLLLVNDGSTDDSTSRALACGTTLPLTIIELSRNFGHPTASRVCMEKADGDAVILMDSDLQDDPAAIALFMEKFEEGYEVVYAVRSSRESWLKKIVFESFYAFIGLLANIRLPLNAGNYSLMSRRVVDHINNVPSGSRYLPGLRAFMGFRQAPVHINRRKRSSGKTRVGITGLLKLAFDGIFLFSYVPIRIFHFIGMVSILTSMCLGSWALWEKIFTDRAVIAWASQFIALSFFSGIIILGISIVGEYVARIYEEIKAFPKYVIDREHTNSVLTPHCHEER
jgi:dolichol-phosphate mannosyltransferase